MEAVGRGGALIEQSPGEYKSKWTRGPWKLLDVAQMIAKRCEKLEISTDMCVDNITSK